ncbi:rod shape-determining protein RodA [Candidatus Giovannonibacteria bacterium]|nr:rod shape-determining protein RodA [Candidatus Giovannonibacteria bacterium]
MQGIFAFSPAKWKMDWVLVAVLVPLLLAGLITMKSLGGSDAEGKGSDYFFIRQLIWVAVGLIFFFLASSIDWRILRNGWLLFYLYLAGVIILFGLLIFARAVRGAESWIRLGLFSIEPAEPMKLILILVLSKYFSRRHIEIAHIRHIIVSGLYAAIPAALIFLQPDFGSAIIFVAIWFGMILVSGVSKRHLFFILAIAALIIFVAWFYLLAPYQKARILTFLNPLRDPRGSGYNALQSMVAVGSGGIMGRGIGYGTQSRLEFLPEHETDFIFAAFAEEWGFLGVGVLFFLFGVLFWRIIKAAFAGESNFEKYFGVGLFLLILSHFIVNVGMNLGLLPITGITLPFLSYGGSHIFILLGALGILMGMRNYGYESGFSHKSEDFALSDVRGA